MQSIVARRNEVRAGADFTNKDWDFEWMVSTAKEAMFDVHEKLRDIHLLCEDKGDVVPTSVIEMMKPSRGAVEMKKIMQSWMILITAL